MFKKLTIATALGAALLSNVAVLADTTPTVTRATDVARFERVRPLPDGITAREAARLRYQHQELKQLQRRANADGEVTRREQFKINQQAAKLRRMVHIAKNN
jgi:hypothetical protein